MKKQIAKIIKKRIKDLGISEYSLTKSSEAIFSQSTLDSILCKGSSKGNSYGIDKLKLICERLEISEMTIDFKNNKTTIKF